MSGRQVEAEPKIIQRLPSITSQTEEVLRIASAANPSGAGIGDVLAAIVLNRKGENIWKGKDVVEAFLVGENRQEFRTAMANVCGGSGLLEIEIDRTQPLVLDQNVRSLIEEARSQSGGVVGTDHLIVAEMARSNSVLRSLMTQSGVKMVTARFAAEISARTYIQESGNSTPEYMLTETKVPELLIGRLSERMVLPESAGRKNRDLVEKAKRGEVTGLVRKEWINHTLHAIDTQRITVIVADHEQISQNIVEGLAGQIALDVKGVLPYHQVVAIDPVDLATNFEAEIIAAINECSRGGILYLPGAQQYLASATEAGARLRRVVANGQVKLLTSMNEQQWHSIYRRDEFVGIRPLFPAPPSVEETIQILETALPELEAELGNGMGIKLASDTIKTAAKIADQYYREVPPPIGAQNLLKRAAMELRLRMSGMDGLADASIEADGVVDPLDVMMALQKLTGIRLAVESKEKYLKMEEGLRQGVIGQEEALRAVADTIRRSKAGFHDGKRPIGSFMFMGPSGVGKTELAKMTARHLFDGDETALVTFDMGEFGEKHTVGRLIGAPPGYIGYEEGGQLTEAVRKKPYAVVLFDEIEKAHPDVLKVMLQILEEGRLTDGHGREVSFKNTVVIMTGNVGSEYFGLENEMAEKVGRPAALAAIKEQVEGVIKASFRPEFLNRVDSRIIFNSLTIEDITKIVDIQLRGLNKRFVGRGIRINVSDEAKVVLAKHNYQPEYGARSLRRTIQELIENPLAQRILNEEIGDNQTIEVGVGEDGLDFRVAEKE